MVRAFVAANVSLSARDVLAGVIHRLQEQEVSGVRWIRPDVVHLTLKFLGDIDPTLVGSILQALGRACQGMGSLHLVLSGVGVFPNLADPRILWVGLNGDLELLRKLQRWVHQEVSAVGNFPTEGRPFSPHLTIGRLLNSVSSAERRRVGKAATQISLDADVDWKVEEVNLMSSTLSPSGARYKVLGSRRLSSGFESET